MGPFVTAGSLGTDAAFDFVAGWRTAGGEGGRSTLDVRRERAREPADMHRV
jgi:hypothetical protein